MDVRLIKYSFVRSYSDHKNPRTYIVLLFPFWCLKYYFINKTKQQPFPPWERLGVLLAAWIQNLVIAAIEAQCLGCERGLDSCFSTVVVTTWHIGKSTGVGAKDEDSGARCLPAVWSQAQASQLLQYSTSFSSAAKWGLCLSYSPKRCTGKIHKVPETQASQWALVLVPPLVYVL